MADKNQFFQLEIITPERIFYQGEAYMIEFNSVNGEMGVYKNHIPLTTTLAPGILNIKEEQGEKQAALHTGFVQILPEKITILAEVAEWPDEIDKNRAKAAHDRAKERLMSHREDVDIERAEIALKKALIRLKLNT